jgi:hypothetical protein
MILSLFSLLALLLLAWIYAKVNIQTVFIYLMGGQVIRVRVKSLTTRRSENNELVSLKWTDAIGQVHHMHTITLDHVSAITFRKGF